MGFSRGDDFDKKEKEAAVAANDEISREREGMEVQMQVQHHGFELEIDEFWPVEHPLEPPDEDRPVKCPMPSATSVLAADSRRISMQEEGTRRTAEVAREGIEVAIEPPVRAMRKRHHHHTLTRNHQHTTRISLDFPSSAHQTHKNITIFEMLQDFDKFD